MYCLFVLSSTSNYFQPIDFFVHLMNNQLLKISFQLGLRMLELQGYLQQMVLVLGISVHFESKNLRDLVDLNQEVAALKENILVCHHCQ